MDFNRLHGLGQVPHSAGPRFALLQHGMLLGISKCVLGISYVPGISYTAGSQVDRNSCPHEADAQRAEEDNKPENKVFRFVKEDTRYAGM